MKKDYAPAPRRRRRALALAAGIALSGCSAYPGLAGRYAADEVAAASGLDPMGGLAYRVCREQAAYAFLVQVQQLDVAPPPWPRWFGETPGPDTPNAALGAKPVTWKQTWRSDHERRGRWSFIPCAEACAPTGARSRRARKANPSTRARSNRRPVSSRRRLRPAAPAPAGAPPRIRFGSAFVAGTKTFVDLYRAKKLEQVVSESGGCMDATFDDLNAFGDALVRRLVDVEHDRALVLRTLDRSCPASPKGDRTLTLVEAMETVGESDRRLRESKGSVSRHQRAIASLKAAHQSLAALAGPKGKGTTDDVKSSLAKLESSVQDLTELER